MYCTDGTSVYHCWIGKFDVIANQFRWTSKSVENLLHHEKFYNKKLKLHYLLGIKRSLIEIANKKNVTKRWESFKAISIY